MMSRAVAVKQVQRNLEQVTGWLSPRFRIKERLRAIRAVDHRQTESRITEDALLRYLPELEQRLQPDLNGHRRKTH